MDALRLAGVDFRYPDRVVLDQVNLAVPEAQVVVLQGRSGAGKSTLLAIAAGLQAPDAGEVRVLGKRLPPPAEAAAMRSRSIGLVFQHLNLLDELNVQENVELPLRLRREGRWARASRTRELLERFGLQELARRMPAQLSGGEQQRVAIARALAPRPAVLLVDEPTSNLDRDNAREVIAALDEAAAAGAGVLVATHDELLTDRPGVYRIERGHVLRVEAGAGLHGERPGPGGRRDGSHAPGSPRPHGDKPHAADGRQGDKPGGTDRAHDADERDRAADEGESPWAPPPGWKRDAGGADGRRPGTR